MAGTSAFVAVLLGGCGVAVVTVIARAKVDIARIRAHSGTPEQPRRP
ncbi:hypothetical protein [Streptomyces sp. H27-H5]|nr:hypothetical protein [Streptomyces sp. H27-H5]MCY0957698.1 hypothetical protein [Streptomyces sp. H27-H5]